MSRAMKDSGIPWLGEIPKEWKLCRFKNFVRLQTTPSVSNKKIGLENIESETGKYIETESKFEGNGVQFYQGDIVYGKLRPYLRKVWLATFDGNAVGDFFVFRARTESDSNYVKWLLLSDGYTEAVNSSVYGAKMPRVSSDFILTLSYFLPPLLEQQRIAEFLDRKCGEIDEAIALQEEFIDELKSYKQSVITEAVTRGLNPNVKFKDSGIDWIGKIPQGWELKKVKYVSTSINKGTGITKDEVFEDGDTPCVRYGEIYSKYNGSFVNCKSYTKKNILTAYRYFNTGDILFAGTGELVEEIGKSIVYLGEKPALAGGDIIILSHNQNPVFLNYALNSFYAQTQKSRGKAKLKVVHISSSEIGNIYLMLPPAAEQLQIADYLDNKCTEIDSLIAIKQQKIEDLKDYKKSIIYEYVTGKKEIQTIKQNRL